MRMHVVDVVVSVHVNVPSAVGVFVFVFVKRDFERSIEGNCDAVQRRQARHVLAIFKP